VNMAIKVQSKMQEHILILQKLVRQHGHLHYSQACTAARHQCDVLAVVKQSVAA